MEELGWCPPAQQSEEGPLNMRREQIDELDRRIADLLKQRLELACEIGQLKAARNMPVRDGAREDEVIQNVRAVVADPLLSDAVVRVYERLLAESRSLQDALGMEPSAESTLYFPRVAIIGCGLIGGALARAIKRVAPDTVVVGLDNAETLEMASSAGAIDVQAKSLADAVKKASLIVLAAGPQENVALLEQLAPLVKRRQVIVDVSSTKTEICSVANKLALKADFIGGHPFFGSEKSGFASSSELNVVGKKFVLVPTARSSELTVRRLTRWLEQLGMSVVTCEAEVHDQIVAETSHLLQLLAVAVGAQIAGSEADLSNRMQLSGPALHGLSRLMRSPQKLWWDIVRQNQSAVCNSIGQFVSHLNEIESAIRNDRPELMELKFTAAKRVSEALPDQITAGKCNR